MEWPEFNEWGKIMKMKIIIQLIFKEGFENIAKYYIETSNLIFTTIKLNDTFGANDTRNKVFNIWNKISALG